LLSRILKLIGSGGIGSLFPIDERYQDTYTRRKLYLHTASLENFASSSVPRKVSRQIERIAGLTDIYTIGLEGNRQLMGCFYIFSAGADLLPYSELVESFTFQVALALEKTKYAEDLKLSEQQFQTIFEYAPDGYYLCDLQGNFLDGNLEAERITGYQRGELIGKNFLTAGLITANQIPKAVTLLTKNQLGRSTGPDEFVLTRRDGSRIQLEISTHPVLLGERSVILGIARDISNRKQAEETLARAYDSLTRVLEGIDAHVYVADLENYEILYMNKKMIEDYGGNFTGKHCYRVFRGESRPCSICTKPQLLNLNGEPGEVVVWEAQNVKNGRWYRNYDRVIYWIDQRLVKLQIAIDITDNRAASSALIESEERYRRLFETAHDAVMTLEPPEWLFTSGNPALVKMFALPNEAEFLTYKPWDLSPEFQPDGQTSKAKARKMIETAVNQGSHFFHWVHKRTNDEEFPATVQLTRVNHDDKVFLQATVRDITEQLASEEKLQQQMDDLELINRLNVAANQGSTLEAVISLFTVEMNRIFGTDYSCVFLIKTPSNSLMIEPELMSPDVREAVIKLIKPLESEKIELDLDQLDEIRDCLLSGKDKALNKKQEILELMTGIAKAAMVPAEIQKGMRSRFPQLVEREHINAAMLIPLLAGDEHFGLLLVTSSEPFPERSQERLLTYTEQLSGVFHRLASVQEREEKIRELELIYRTFLEGSRLDDVDDICQHLADKIHEVNPGCYVAVSLFDPDEHAILVRGVSFAGDLTDRVIKLIGIGPKQIKINTQENEITTELNRLFTSGRLELVPNGLYDLTRGTIPKAICRSAERLAEVEKTYIVGFGTGPKSTGGIVIFVKEGQKIHFPAAIETIASHFAAVFERRQIQEEIRNRKAQLEALRDIELDIASQLNLEQLLYSIADKAVSIVNAVATGFSIYNPERGILEFFAYTGYDAIPDHSYVSVGEGLAGRVWQTKKTIIVDNYLEWTGRAEAWVPYGNYYLAGIPVCWGDEILGVLEIALNIGERLSSSDIEILELFATQAAIAIKNARLFSEEQLRRQEAETLREGGMLINQMLGRPELLDMILTALGRVVPCSSAFIQLVKGSGVAVEAVQGPEGSELLIGTKQEMNGSPLYQQILFEGNKVVLNTRKEIEELSAGPASDEDQSWLAVPLEIKGNRIGLISINSPQSYQYSRQDADLVYDFASQAAIAIENSRLFDELRRRTREIEVVYESALVLTRELHPERFLEYLNEQIDHLFNPDSTILATYDQHSETIRIDYAREGGVRLEDLEGTEVELADKNSLLSWITRAKTPLLIGNLETDTLPLRPHQQGETMRSFLGVPLMVGERMIGVLAVEAYQAQAFSQEHRRLLQLMGNQVAVSLENSRLFEDAQRRLSRLGSLRDVDQAITGSLDLDRTMDVLISQLLKTLSVDAACVQVYNPEQGVLEHLSSQGFWYDHLGNSPTALESGLAGEVALTRAMLFIPDLAAEAERIPRWPQLKKEEFVSYLAHPLIAKGELVGVLEVFHRSPLDPDPEWNNFLDALAKLAAIAIDRLNLYNNLVKSNIELAQAYDATIEGWARAIELRDGETEGHSRRVASIVLNLARKMGVKGSALTHIRWGALLHDIGKMAIPDGILLNPGKLTAEEWTIMKKHPFHAYQMLSEIEYLRPALDVPYCHHERWDGSGYPRGLTGEAIPFAARIFAVVDVWDALQSNRPYRPAWSEKKAIQYLKDQAGIEFDPLVVEAFMELIGK
jgi:PAS domain S-box-containing protein/putative nucleotidyltransferase with HDIG domain